MNSTRCFVAVPVSPPALSLAQRLIGQLKSTVSNVKWTRPDQLHVTIKFLGDVDNRDLPQVCQELRKACQTIEPFHASLNGIGSFPRNKPPRILWAKVDMGSGQLEQLYQQLDQSLSELGIPLEGKAYMPHLTLGRVGRGANLELLQETLESLAPQVSAEFDVNEVILYSSIRERGGFLYDPIDTVGL